MELRCMRPTNRHSNRWARRTDTEIIKLPSRISGRLGSYTCGESIEAYVRTEAIRIATSTISKQHTDVACEGKYGLHIHTIGSTYRKHRLVGCYPGVDILRIRKAGNIIPEG